MPPTRKNTLPQDLPFIKSIVEMFLNNEMTEAEAACQRREDLKDQRLYVRTAASLMRSMRALMSFEQDDIIDAQVMVQETLNLADQTRLAVSWTSRLANFPFDASLSNARRMSTEQLHAELVYAECLLEKAIMGFLSSGDWMSFLREALNIRSVVAIYRTLHSFLEEYDNQVKRGMSPSAAAEHIDEDFRSGVCLGMGMCLLVFSMIPSRIFADLLGYRGDRYEALRLLRKAGGWRTDKHADRNHRVPQVSKERGGARRPLCDLVLIVFHLVISGFTREGVDVQEAEDIVEWNLRQYPDSIFFLFGKGRLHVTRSRPDLAIEVYQNAKSKITNQTGYEQLGSVMLWEMALCHLALGQWRESAECWGAMKETAKWSKAIYAYGKAACLLQTGNLTDTEQEEADKLMKEVPQLLQRIAGKSIPLEKYVARKAERYIKGEKLVTPALELAYMLQATNRTTDKALMKHAQSLESLKNSNLESEDDRQLVNLLLAATYRHIDFPNSEDIVSPNEKRKPKIVEHIPKEHQVETIQLLKRAKDSGSKLKQEYWVAYFAHYELGRLYEELGNYTEARQCFSTVASGSSLEGPNNSRKGKYSLQNAIMLRASASIATLPQTPSNASRPAATPDNFQ
ncbi:Tetratricopeptide repeat protein 39B [Ceratobasidium theobromae]|uniref:Tetratricopeptide repeat protein 39B n=1 Tax=Ceratobasidium theobromae TaxID=1582974 RepID=A0A5N5QHF6_9AGAM|nr:Tetratricopeptide repeat protein 39B [Ceratobasidium theobromae]